MIRFITGNEREIEGFVNEELENIPGARILGAVAPYLTTRGVMFCATIDCEVSADDKDTGGGNKPVDGRSKKATQS